jgi:hypothetical protein
MFFWGGALRSLGKRFQCWSHTFAEISLVMIAMINIEYSFSRIFYYFFIPFSGPGIEMIFNFIQIQC